MDLKGKNSNVFLCRRLMRVGVGPFSPSTFVKKTGAPLRVLRWLTENNLAVFYNGRHMLTPKAVFENAAACARLGEKPRRPSR